MVIPDQLLFLISELPMTK